MTSPLSVVEVTREAAQAASSVTSGTNEYTLSSGVVVLLKPVPPLAMREAAIQATPPRPPMVRVEDRDQEVENTADPDYLKAIEAHQAKQLYLVSDVMMMLGVDIINIPDDVFPPESEEWSQMLEAVGINIPEQSITNKYARRLTWMRLYVARSESDIATILSRIIALSGVTELEVQRAAAAFLRASGW